MARGQRSLGDYLDDTAEPSTDTDGDTDTNNDTTDEHDEADTRNAADTSPNDDELSPGAVKDAERVLSGINDVSAYINEQGTIEDYAEFARHAQSKLDDCIARGSTEDIRTRNKWGVRFASDYVSGEVYYDQSIPGSYPNLRAELTVQHGHNEDETSTVEIILPCLTLPETAAEDLPIPDSRELDVDALKSDETRIINIKESEISKDETVYIGRSGSGDVVMSPTGEYTQFGNPHEVGNCQICGAEHTREEAIELFKAAFAARLKNDPAYRDEVESLRGETLACWCKPEPCHGDVIKSYLDGEFDVESWASEFEVQAIADVPESGYDTAPVWIDVELPAEWEPDESDLTPNREECLVIGGRSGGACEREATEAFYFPIEDKVSWFCSRHAAEARDDGYGPCIDLASARPELFGDEDPDVSVSL